MAIIHILDNHQISVESVGKYDQLFGWGYHYKAVCSCGEWESEEPATTKSEANGYGLAHRRAINEEARISQIA